MQSLHPKTLILRHRKENLKKCSLKGLEKNGSFCFYTYPKDELPRLEGYALLTLGAKPLTEADSQMGLLLLDGTWRHAEKMAAFVKRGVPMLQERSIPDGWQTAYPRCQNGCLDPSAGLASIEALWISNYLLGRPREELFCNYYWKQLFFDLNKSMIK